MYVYSAHMFGKIVCKVKWDFAPVCAFVRGCMQAEDVLTISAWSDVRVRRPCMQADCVETARRRGYCAAHAKEVGSGLSHIWNYI